MNNLPQRFDLSARKGAVLGPIEVVVSGIDLALYNLTGTPDMLTVTSATTFVMAFSATLLDGLPFGQHPGFAAGNSRYWVDATPYTPAGMPAGWRPELAAVTRQPAGYGLNGTTARSATTKPGAFE